MEIPEGHPRRRSLEVREKLSALVEEGVVSRTGLIAQGRGEAFDYLLGERTSRPAHEAIAAAAALLLEAERPVITVNGNAAALCADGLLSLARAVPAKVEVNLFHRSPERVERVVRYLESRGGEGILGRNQTAVVHGIASDRAMCEPDGIFAADVVMIPLEDGDRAQALSKAGKKVIAIDLNPLSRTALAADVPIVDELSRAVPLIEAEVARLRADPAGRRGILERFDPKANLELSRRVMLGTLEGM